jgi:hypothetical protein
MTKTFILSVLFLLIAGAVSSQGFRLGLKAGINMNQISGQSFNQSYDLAYHAGAFAEIDFTKKLGIQPELLFNQSSSKTVSGGLSSVTFPSDNVTLNYLSIPILLRYNIGSLVTLNLGPQFSILMNKHDNLLTNGQNAFKSGDFAMVGGLQLNLKILRVYGRYVIGMNNINDVSNSENWKNQQIQLGIGLKL